MNFMLQSPVVVSLWLSAVADPDQGLDGAPFVHRGVGVGDVVEVGAEVEDLAGVDGAVKDGLEQLGLVGARASGAAAHADVAVEGALGVDRRVVGDSDPANDRAGL